MDKFNNFLDDFNMDRELAYLLAYINGGIVAELTRYLQLNSFIEILIGTSICAFFFFIFCRLWGEEI